MNGTEQKEEKLELVFGTEKLLESAKEPFVGEVIYAEFPCHCVDCEKGARSLEKMFVEQGRSGDTAPDRLHIQMKPLTVYTKVQFQWWIPTKTKLSRWGALQKQLEILGIMEKFKTDREKAFMGIVAEWQWTQVDEVGVSNVERDVFHWIPVRILTDADVAALKTEPVAGQTGDVSSGGAVGDEPTSGAVSGEPSDPKL